MARRGLPLTLRARATIGFGLTGLIVSVVLAGVTYGVARSYLLDQREEVARNQTYVNARLARNVLRAPEPDPSRVLAGLGGGTASTGLIRFRDEWYSASVAVGPDDLPSDLLQTVSDGRAGQQRTRDSDGELQLVVGVPVAALDAAYFELFPLTELERTLELITRALATGAAGATVVAAAVGWFGARRLVRPLRPVADAAVRIADGALDTRLDPEPDPDLRRLAESFNSMAAALEARIEREARFAADVSHELRSPLAAVSAALEVIDRRRDGLPDQVTGALDVLRSKVDTFEQMVLDLLEISRIDAGSVTLSREPLNVRELVERLLELHAQPDASVEFVDGAPEQITGDRRRLAQALGNIVDNAKRYAGGVSRIIVDRPRDSVVRIVIEDRGPGIPPEERESIFGRFARGKAGREQGTASGTGLGLALVIEHLALHHGHVTVEDAPNGGARFVVELPVERSAT